MSSITVNCQNCGKAFNTSPSILAHGRGKHCSPACQAASFTQKNDVRFEGDVCYLQLTNRLGEVVAETAIDREDTERVLSFKRRWCLMRHHSGKYRVYAKGEDQTNVYLHRFIMDAPSGLLVDHRDRDMLNNRKENLRVCTNGQNSQNLKYKRANNTSGARGVWWNSRRKKWQAQVIVSGRIHYLGLHKKFEDAEAAAIKGRCKYMTHSEN